MNRIFVLIGLLTISASPRAVELNRAQAEAMKKMVGLVGEWRGTGSIQFGRDRWFEFSSSETVESKLGGLLLVIEGIHKVQFPGQDIQQTVHHAVGVLSYDHENHKYQFKSHLADGRGGDHEAHITSSGFIWGYNDPRRGRVRYTITITEDGEWSEIGEATQDGELWKRFFEMKLSRYEHQNKP